LKKRQVYKKKKKKTENDFDLTQKQTSAVAIKSNGNKIQGHVGGL
jgi:hypothetical protein